MSLAVATGVGPDVWAAEGVRSIRTAAGILREQERSAKRGGKGGDPGGPQMSG